MSGVTRLLSSVRMRTVRTTLRERGWAQRTVIALFLTLGGAVFFGAFFVFARAFRFIAEEPFAGPVIARYVLESSMHVVFLLGAASFVSVAVRFMFAAREVRLLAALPLEPETLFLYRMTSATAFASWPVLLLGVPAMIAFGNAVGAGAAYYFGALLVLILFIAAIAATGALLAFAVAPLLCRCRQATRLIVQAVGLVAFCAFLVSTAVPRGIFGEFFFVTSPAVAAERIARIKEWFAFSPGRPFSDLLASVLPFNGTAVGPVFVGTAIGVAILYIVLYAVVRRRYIRMIQLHGETGFLARAEDIGPVHPRHAFPAIFKWRHGFLFEKDLLSFFRDPDEVSRAALLGVLLMLYIFAARGVTRIEAIGPAISVWALTFAFGAIGYFCLAFALRFVFPSLSREGKSAWVFWSSPVHIHEFFSWKLFFWTFLIGTGCAAAAVLTVLLFRMPVPLALFFMYATLCASIAIVAIALGQGVISPDFGEDDPDVLTTSPAGLATTAIGLTYLLVVGRYLYDFASDYLLRGGRMDLLDGFGILIVTVGVVTIYWIFAPRSMDAREIG